MKKDLAVLIMIIVAILAFILGYSLSPSPTVKQGKGSPPSSGAPGYGSENAPSSTTAPGYDDGTSSKPPAPGYGQ